MAQALEHSQLQASHLEPFCSFFICWAHTRVDVFGSKSDLVFPCCVFIPPEEGGGWKLGTLCEHFVPFSGGCSC